MIYSKMLRDLFGVYRRRRVAYFIWLLANLGGLLVAYLATFTIWVFHRKVGSLLPRPEAFLITGALSVAVAGVSYFNLFHGNRTLQPSLLFLVLWPFLLTAVYGILIAMGVQIPIITDASIWVIAIAVSALCLAWASVTWLHLEGLILDQAGPPPAPTPPALGLTQAAATLPRLDAPPPPVEGDDLHA